MDWAGTAVDYGCFAPLNAFLKVFKEERGIDITYRQAREPMGLLKIDHIRAILRMPEVGERFHALYKRDWNEDDVRQMYVSFEKHLFASLEDFTEPIPGVLETMDVLLSDQPASILPVGILAVEGQFDKDDIVRIYGPDNRYIGVGKSAFSSGEVSRLIGKHGQRPAVHYDYLYIE